MMPRLTRLRIAGFKSFAEPASLDILPGLTGIVGPNGCGKSNVVEALRWAMGETSARSLRGGEMDDIIFAGTTARASRNLAEVTVTIEPGTQEPGGTALPAPFDAELELQVTRRIERGAGSTFRANGRELRARDVQTLYADLASGARSSGMVSQGRVADLVRARPEERRQLLEEAAGITGLHARRHEAELKLRAAEQNVTRAGDLRSQLDGARDGLRRQAREATRYRAISGLIRAAEAEHLGVLHGQAEAALQHADRALSDASEAVDAASAEAATTAAALAEAEVALPGLRRLETEARSALDRCRFAAETLAADALRAEQEADSAGTRLRDLAADLDAATKAHGDAGASVDRIAETMHRQGARLARLPELIDAASRQASQSSTTAEVARTEADEAVRRHMIAATAALQAEATMRGTAARLATMQADHETLLADHETCIATRIPPRRLAEAESETASAEARLALARDRLAQSEADRAEAADITLSARAAAERGLAARQAAALAVSQAAGQVDRLRSACQSADDALRRHTADRTDARRVAEAQAVADRAQAGLAAAEAGIECAEQEASAAASLAEQARHALEAAVSARARAAEAVSAAQAHAARLAAEAIAAESAWTAAGAGPNDAALAEAEAACLEAERIAAACNLAWRDARAARQSDGEALEQARADASSADADVARLRGEAEGLAAALGNAADGFGLLDAIRLPDGLDRALGAALGDGLSASLDQEEHCFWRALPPLPVPALPTGSIALGSLVEAPAALSRALAHVALLDDGVDGNAVQPWLPAGMLAVDRSGACWRWDGHVTRAGAPNQASSRLALRRRLADATAKLEPAVQAAAHAHARLTDAQVAMPSCLDRETACEQADTLAATRLREALQAAERLQDETARAVARRLALQPAMERLSADRSGAEQALARARQAMGALPDPADLDRACQAAAAQAQARAQALDGTRAARTAARTTASQASAAAQSLANTAQQTEMLIAAAAETCSRNEAEMRAGLHALSVAEDAGAALPDQAGLIAAQRAAEADEADRRAQESAARDERQTSEATLDGLRRTTAQLRQAQLETEARLVGLSDRLARGRSDLEAARQLAEQAEHALSAGPDVERLAVAAGAATQALDAARQAAAEAQVPLAALQAEQAHAESSQDGLRAELDAWRHRLEEAQLHRAALAERHRAAQQAWSALAGRPVEIAERTARSDEGLAAAEMAHRQAAALLAEAEHAARERSAAWRDAAEREAVGRDRQRLSEARQASCAGALSAVLARAADRLGEATTLPRAGELSDQSEERARRKFERLSREREEMGPVNLRAELELQALDERVAAIDRESEELGTAIAKLRGAIGQLNREGRTRLQAVFTEVDAHFRTLFTRMMGGGQAHLALSGTDDPLSAGLEIYAEPPGKKLSALSLLSGGEQALTALSLIFAVFRCTPAPLCVLDEVDAPLDDANVERFCTLLDDVMRETGTSFLVVTHHQLTMSRMDRLFGVTMQERGVSRLLSVDLRQASAMVEPVLQAAAE